MSEPASSCACFTSSAATSAAGCSVLRTQDAPSVSQAGRQARRQQWQAQRTKRAAGASQLRRRGVNVFRHPPAAAAAALVDATGTESIQRTRRLRRRSASQTLTACTHLARDRVAGILLLSTGRSLASRRRRCGCAVAGRAAATTATATVEGSRRQTSGERRAARQQQQRQRRRQSECRRDRQRAAPAFIASLRSPALLAARLPLPRRRRRLRPLPSPLSARSQSSLLPSLLPSRLRRRPCCPKSSVPRCAACREPSLRLPSMLSRSPV